MTHPEGKKLMWKGEEIASTYEMERAIEQIETEKEAKDLLKAFREYTPYADKNIGYFLSRMSHERSIEMRKMFYE